MNQYVLHPWHGAHYGNKQPQEVNALIEISQGSKCKHEIVLGITVWFLFLVFFHLLHQIGYTP